MSTEEADTKSKNDLVIWAATIVGLLAGSYGGINLLIPLAGTAITFFVLKKLVTPQKAIWFWAISVQVGHALWFIVGLAYLGKLDANILDPVILLLGVLWLFVKPGIAPVLVLSVIQLTALSYNVYVFSGTDFGSNANKALFVHITFRALALSLMGFALYKSRKHLHDRVAAH